MKSKHLILSKEFAKEVCLDQDCVNSDDSER